METRLGGVAVAAITPRRDSGHEIDFGAALEVIDFLTGAGVSAVALLGSTGEFVHFDFEERTRLAAFVVKRTKLPVIVNVSHSTLDGALDLAAAAEDAGAAALLLMPPYFFRYGQADVEQFFLEFARQLPRPVPTLIYNIPAFTTPVEPDTACRLLATGLFAGIKDSSGDLEGFQRLLDQCARAPFILLAGNDAVFTAARRAGADGVISGCAGAVPELLLALDRAILAGDSAKTARLDARLQEFIARIDALPTPVGVREAVRLRGLKIGPHATSTRDRTLEEFADWFPGWFETVRREC